MSGGPGDVTRRVRFAGSPGPAGRAAACVVLAAALAIGLGGCSGSSGAVPDPAGTATAAVAADGVQTADLVADGSLRFAPAVLVVRPGRVRLTVRVTGSVAHDWRIVPVPGAPRRPDGSAAELPLIPPGAAATIDVVADAAGEFLMDCPLHAGMTARLRVVAP